MLTNPHNFRLSDMVGLVSMVNLVMERLQPRHIGGGEGVAFESPICLRQGLWCDRYSSLSNLGKLQQSKFNISRNSRTQRRAPF